MNTKAEEGGGRSSVVTSIVNSNLLNRLILGVELRMYLAASIPP